jgi:NTE family protein
MRWGLALSGGGLLGAAHLGVLRALQEWGLQAPILAGTSAGGLVAGVLSAGGDLAELTAYGARVSRDPLRYLPPAAISLLAELVPDDPLPPAGSLLDSLPFVSGLLTLCPQAHSVRDWRWPTALTAVDLACGEAVVFLKRAETALLAPRGRWREAGDAPLATALQATMAMPGIFTPVRASGTFLVDGGVADTLPVDWAVALGARRVLAVQVAPLRPTLPPRAGILWSLSQSAAYATVTLSSLRRPAHTPLLLLTPDTAGVSPLDFGAYDALVEAGYGEAVRRRSEIESFLTTAP